MSGDVLSKSVEEIRGLLEERLRIKGRTLAQQVGKLGRRVPKRVRKDAEYLVQAEALTQHPKLAQMIDPRQVTRARDNVVSHLKTVDPKEIRKDKILWALAKASAFVIIAFIGLVWFAWDRGMI